MEEVGSITGYIDVAQMLLYAFWIFFFGLIFYLQKESRREGYPLESDSGRKENHGMWMARKPKVFRVKHGDEIKKIASNPQDTRELALKKTSRAEGMPYEPTGDPMIDQVGPASYTERGDHPDYDLHGGPKIVPIRVANDFFPAEEDNDPRGMTVYGCDGKEAGKCTDIWVDTGEFIGRYLEVETPAGPRLLPFTAFKISGSKNIFTFLSGIEPMKEGIFCKSITAEQFKTIPTTKHPDQITLREEDMVMGYVGGGRMYATKERQEPII